MRSDLNFVMNYVILNKTDQTRCNPDFLHLLILFCNAIADGKMRLPNENYIIVG